MCGNVRALVASPNTEDKFCEQWLFEQPFAKMAHILVGKDLGASYETKDTRVAS